MGRILLTCLVTILPLSYISASDTLTLVGSLESQNVYSTVSEIDGVISSFGYERGEKTRQDQPLVFIKDQDQQLILDQAKASLRLAKADLKAKKARFERYKELEAKNNLAKEQLDDAEAAYRMGQSSIELENIALKRSRLDVERTRITADSGLWVTERLINVGDWVQKGQVLYRLENTDQLKAVLYVTERQVARVHEGQSVTLVAEALPDRTFAGKVSHVGIKPDVRRNNYAVDIVVDNSKRLLRPGFTVDAHIAIQ